MIVKWLRMVLAALPLAAPAYTALAQEVASYPARPVTIVVPTPPAGGSDIVARLFADALGKSLKQSFVVDNRPGANGILGTDYAAKGPADGYRLLFTYAAAMVVNPALYKKLPYDALRDFAPIAQIGRGGQVLLVRSGIPAATLAEFVAYANANPGKLNYCSWGSGSGGHLAMEYLKKRAGVTMTHVPYKGVSACVQGLIGEQVDAAFLDASSTLEFIKAGRLKALVYNGATRLPMLPELPTMKEAGYPYTAYAWYGFFAPAKASPAIVKKLNEAVNQALKDPAMVKRLNELNLSDLPVVTPEQFAATVANDLNDWGALVSSIGLTLD